MRQIIKRLIPKQLLAPLMIKQSTSTTKRQLLQTSDASKRVLVVEFNGGHTETMPGYAHYFLALGYAVDVLIYQDTIFSRYTHPKLRVFALKRSYHPGSLVLYRQIMLNLVQDEAVNKLYDHIFINSYLTVMHQKEQPVHDLIGRELFARLPIITVVHGLDNLQIGTPALATAKFVSLVTLPAAPLRISAVNPHQVGPYITPRKQDKTIFIGIGRTVGEPHNIHVVEQVVKALDRINGEFWFVSRSEPLVVHPRVKHLRNIGFDQLFTAMEQAHFLLPLFDPTLSAHHNYKDRQSSGNYQLAYGFAKPMIIEESFAKLALVTMDNGFVYQGNDQLQGALISAAALSNDQYQQLVQGMQATALQLTKQSLATLQQLLDS